MYESLCTGQRRCKTGNAGYGTGNKRSKIRKDYLIFAEGTRTKNPNHVNEFKGGSFKCAMKAQCPIVPVALIDSYKPFECKLN